MLQTKIINDNICAVAYDPTEIMVRHRGKVYYGTERQLVALRDGKLHIFMDVAKYFDIEVVKE